MFLAVVALRWQVTHSRTEEKETGQTPAEMLVFKLTFSSEIQDFWCLIIKYDTILQREKCLPELYLEGETYNELYIIYFYMVYNWEARKQNLLPRKRRCGTWPTLRHAVVPLRGFPLSPGESACIPHETVESKNQLCPTVTSGVILWSLHLNYSDMHWRSPREEAVCEDQS